MSKRYTFFLLAVLVCSGYVSKAQTEQQKRITIAELWLEPFCVVTDGKFASFSKDDLSTAFLDWTNKRNVAVQCRSEPAKGKRPVRAELKDMYPGLVERLLRATEFRLNIQQTPSYVFGTLEGDPSSTPSIFHANPDHSVLSYGGPIHFEELFVDSQVRTAVCTAIKDDAIHDESYIAHCENRKYVTASRKVDRWTRIATAVSLDLKFSQVPKYENGQISTNPADFPKQSKTITGSFDPKKLFRSIAEQKAVGDYLATVHNLTDVRHVCGHDKTEVDTTSTSLTAQCVREIAMGGDRRRTALYFAPKIDVTVTTPFDLAKFGNTFLAPPGRTDQALYAVALSWNLQGVIPSASARADGLKVLNQLSAKSAAVSNVDWQTRVRNSYLELLIDPERSLDPQWWARFEGLMIGQDKVSTPTP